MWKTLSSKEIFNHPRLTLIEDEVMLPNGIKTTYLKYKDSGRRAATIVCKRDDGKILLSKEYSYPPNQTLFQFPGGKISPEENMEKGANRELMEETNYKANKLILLGNYLINNRRSNIRMHVYLATDLQEEFLERDMEEDIENFWFTENEIEAMIKNGEIINCHVLAAWSLYKIL